MKYFSPNILDGSVTTAKIADGAVNATKLATASVTQIKIKTSVSSQGGSVPGSGSVLVSLSSYTFFMDTEMENGLNGRLVPVEIAVPAANANAPQFNIKNNAAPARLYDVKWRHVVT